MSELRSPHNRIVATAPVGLLAGADHVGTELAGSLINFITGSEPRAIIGIPIVLIILAYLLNQRTKEYFDESITKKDQN
jgi:hypothetical protein